MDVSQYLEIFLDETREHLQSLNTEILNLEQDPENMDTVNEIFRAAHSLKGMAGTMGYKRMQNLTHDMENVFSEVRNGTIKIKSNMIDILFQCLDALEEYTANIQETSDEGTNENEALIKLLNDCLKSEEEEAEEAAVKETAGDEAAAKEQTGSENGQWKDIQLHDAETHVLLEALKQGKNVFGITVKVQESCILKAARAFLVFKAIEELGEIVVSSPPAQDIEDEHFDLHFSVIVITSADLESILNAARGVSEIESVEGGEVIVEAEEEEEPQTEEISAPESDKQGALTASQPSGMGGAQAAPAVTPAKQEKKSSQSKAVGNRTVRVDIEKLDVLMNLVSELIIAKNSLVSASTKENGGGGNAVNEHIEYLESVTTSLHESVMKVRMVPIESVVNKFPRMIRDLSKTLNKKMDLHMSGEETELDRTVVDEIGDPLMHLLRNSADHGLESAELRKERGKPETGTIFLNAYQDGNNVVIEVGDDGNGIDVEAVKNKAIDRGVITPDQADDMSDKEIIDLLFLPSFSTAKQITDVSGRGVGLDVVKSKVESLSGEVEVKTKLGEGSTWTIRLPLTLAIIQALMVEVGGEKYAISLGSVVTLEDIKPSEVKLVEAKEVINLRGQVIPLIRMNEVLDVESTRQEGENMTVAIVKKGDKQAGLMVDKLMGQQEIVIKSLGKYININKIRIISGATILGDGEVALILDTNALI